MENYLTQYLNHKFKHDIRSASDREVLEGLLCFVKEKTASLPNRDSKGRKLYYVSAEFLIGRLLGSNLLNLGLYEEAEALLKKHGKSLGDIQELETEPSLGNGGLGRLAACFLDSIGTLNLNGVGIGLNYHFGLFHQNFENNRQSEYPDRWLNQDKWLTRTDTVFPIRLGNHQVNARMYQLDVTGYHSDTCTKLNLFDLEGVNEDLVQRGIDFDKKDILHNLTLFLYPDDSDDDGRILRVYQQYFLSSAAAQLILKETKDGGKDLHKLNQYVVVQLNDTHPSMIIPELIRLLMKEGISMREAAKIVSRTCAYTNHTILAEALEVWPMHFLKKAVPELIPIIRYLDEHARDISNNPVTDIIDKNRDVHMAHMDIHYSFSTNGVAKLHTDILKNTELKPFYDLYPERFSNKSNGITFRRWLMLCNPKLSSFITELIGEGWKEDAEELSKLKTFAEDEKVLERLLSIKAENKKALAEYIQQKENIIIDAESVYDVQIKRLHEYKRQQMNALYAIWKYFQIKEGKLPERPITMIFGAKAAPAYTIAKDIIHLILCLQQLFHNDPQVDPYLKIVMVENYNVSYAEKLIPACDISEQISLASKEASGTGNMKLMLNGALTLGTMDGANVEIHDFVGEDNIYVFGKSSEEVIKLYADRTYNSGKIYDSDPEIEKLVDFIISKQLIRIGDVTSLCRLYKEIVGKDWFMTLLDVKEYIEVKEKMLSDYEDRKSWAKKMLHNIAGAGYFSSDRTISQYQQEIWKL